MMVFFLLLLAEVTSVEYIIKFDYYDLRKNLLSNHVHRFLHSYVHNYSYFELNAHSDFLVIDTESNLPSVPAASEVCLNSKINRKPLIFKASNSGRGTADLYPLKELWGKGLEGRGIKVGVLDSGISQKDLGQIEIEECQNFTSETDCEDGTGHGTYMASLLKSTNEGCPGIAPKAELYVFKVFTNSQESYTSWFLEAMNYALKEGINVISLSNGGIDYTEKVFVDKIKELAQAGVLVIAAAGNDGPAFGTMNNPADQPEVLAVGGIDFYNEISAFSSRGPTLWEIASGAGRVKPDLVTYANDVLGLYQGRCITNRGTSVATPMVAGIAALLSEKASSTGHLRQALISSADKLSEVSMFEQGGGSLNALSALDFLSKKTSIQALPAQIDLSDTYFYPYSLQPLHEGGLPVIFNVTLMHIDKESPLKVTEIQKSSDYLSISIEIPSNFSMYTATMGLFISLEKYISSEEWIKIRITSNEYDYFYNISLQATPADRPKVLWDLSHSVKFPEKPAIRDEVEEVYLYDWRGDHPFTNMLKVYEKLLDLGFSVDFLFTDYGCVQSDYDIFLIIDNELAFNEYEVQKIRYNVEMKGMSLLIFAEWDDSATLESETISIELADAITGSNVRAINELLSPYFIEMSSHKQVTGSLAFAHKELSISRGTEITRFPAESWLVSQKLIDHSDNRWKSFAVLGMTTVGNGTVSILTDSSCLDPHVTIKDCLWVIEDFLAFAMNRTVLQEEFKLPYDYDLHIEGSRSLQSLDIPEISDDRNLNLKCEYQRDSIVEQFESTVHERTRVKIRDWSPNAGIYTELDSLTVAQIGISAALIIVIAAFCIHTKRRRRLL